MVRTLTQKQKDVLKLALKLEKGKRGDVELFLLDLIHQIQEIAKGEKGEDAHTPTDEELLALIKPLIPKPEKGDDGHTPTDKELLTLIRPLIPKPVKGEDGKMPTEEELLALIEPLIPQPLEGSPDAPEDIKVKLELLKGDERLDASAIKGLEDIVRKNTSARVQTPAKAFRVYTKDCSSQCDGANKSFTVGGSHFGVIGVFCTSFPIVLRPVIDYTETRTGFTLTAAVTAPLSDQTLICQFLK